MGGMVRKNVEGLSLTDAKIEVYKRVNWDFTVNT